MEKQKNNTKAYPTHVVTRLVSAKDYREITNVHGITLIALVITIIILLILAGVVLNLTIGENGIIKKAQQTGGTFNEAQAREKLELVLIGLQADKVIDTTYNENDYIDRKIVKNKMEVSGNIVNVGGWQFEIDRSVPKIVSSLGKIDEIITEPKAILTVKNTEDGKILIRIEAAIPNDTMQLIEIYDETNNKIETINVPIGIKQIQKEKEIYIDFMENKTYYAEIIGENSALQTNTINAKNENAIASEKDLKKLAGLVNTGETYEGKTLIQTKDIELTNAHTIIGTISNPFKGTYNGQEKNISNIIINNASLENVGLFGYIENATLMNVSIGEGTITAGNKIGGIVGYAKNSNLDNLKNSKTDIIASNTYTEIVTDYVDLDFGTTIVKKSEGTPFISAGGICGIGENTNIQNCINSANTRGISLGCAIGGIIGYDKGENVKILKCVNMGNIKDAIGLGGIVGYTNGGIKIEECINKGIIGRKDNVSIGGIGGICMGGNILNCRNEGNVTGLSCISGIVGYCTSKSLTTYFEVQNSSNFGVITSTGYNKATGYNTANSTYSRYNSCGTGGIIGYGTKTKVSDCYNAETLIKQADCNDLGGIVGSLRNGEITRCYNKGIINSNKTGYGIGGILGGGYYNIKVNNCYNSGNVIGYGSTGGIAGLTCQIDLRYCYNIGNIEGTWSLRWNCRVYWTV